MSRALPPDPKVSIHIVSYNQADFIAEAISSAVEQDYANLEVVVSDDASTDRTSDIIREFSDRYPRRLKPVLNPVNLGITGNSNAGLAACTGDLIAFMGGDDVLVPGKIAAQVAWFRESSTRVLCAHQVEVFYDDEARPAYPLSRHMISGKGAEGMIRHQPFGATSVMVRSDALPPWGFREELPIVSDIMLWIDILASGGEYGFVEGTYARYRKHDANVTNDPFRHLDEVRRTLEFTRRDYPQYADAVRYAEVRRLLYDPGVAMLASGRRQQARKAFADVLRREPTFVKAWIRLAQSLA
jgi:glycosyltransferase involved in cell wall biosynthesis